MRGIAADTVMRKLTDLATLWIFSLLFEGAVQLLRKLRGGGSSGA